MGESLLVRKAGGGGGIEGVVERTATIINNDLVNKGDLVNASIIDYTHDATNDRYVLSPTFIDAQAYNGFTNHMVKLNEKEFLIAGRSATSSTTINITKVTRNKDNVLTPTLLTSFTLPQTGTINNVSKFIRFSNDVFIITYLRNTGTDNVTFMRAIRINGTTVTFGAEYSFVFNVSIRELVKIGQDRVAVAFGTPLQFRGFTVNVSTLAISEYASLNTNQQVSFSSIETTQAPFNNNTFKNAIMKCFFIRTDNNNYLTTLEVGFINNAIQGKAGTSQTLSAEFIYQSVFVNNVLLNKYFYTFTRSDFNYSFGSLINQSQSSSTFNITALNNTGRVVFSNAVSENVVISLLMNSSHHISFYLHQITDENETTVLLQTNKLLYNTNIASGDSRQVGLITFNDGTIVYGRNENGNAVLRVLKPVVIISKISDTRFKKVYGIALENGTAGQTIKIASI